MSGLDTESNTKSTAKLSKYALSNICLMLGKEDMLRVRFVSKAFDGAVLVGLHCVVHQH